MLLGVLHSPKEEPAEKQKRQKRSGVLGDVDFDEERPLAEQLRETLQKHAVRVLDLFRDWDTDVRTKNRIGTLEKWTLARLFMPLAALL